MAETLTHRMATSATGYAAVMDGILNIRTVSETPSMAAVNALALGGINLLSNCADPDCNCKVEALARIMPNVQIVAVAVRATEAVEVKIG